MCAAFLFSLVQSCDFSPFQGDIITWWLFCFHSLISPGLCLVHYFIRLQLGPFLCVFVLHRLLFCAFSPLFFCSFPFLFHAAEHGHPPGSLIYTHKKYGTLKMKEKIKSLAQCLCRLHNALHYSLPGFQTSEELSLGDAGHSFHVTPDLVQ